MVELIAAIAVLTIALMALLAGYGSAFTSMRLASQKTTASQLASSQLELYRALPYQNIGLDSDTVSDIGDDTSGNYNELYSDDVALIGVVDTSGVQAPSGTVNDVAIDSCSTVAPAAACEPVQTVTGHDGHSYEIESFVVDTQAVSTTTGVSWTERIVTIVVRNAEASGDPELLRIASAFDRLPAS